MNQEDFVSFEQAQKLKALGFIEETTHYYDGDGTFEEQRIYIEPSLDGRSISVSYVIDGGYNKYYSMSFDAPTLSQACKWLRSKDILIHILPKSNNKYMTQVWEISTYEILETLRGEFDTYEQAQSAGIDVALELLKKGV